MDTVEPSFEEPAPNYLRFSPDIRTIPTGWDLSWLSMSTDPGENHNGHKNGELVEPDPYRYREFEIHPNVEPQTMPGGWDLSGVLKSKQHSNGHK